MVYLVKSDWRVVHGYKASLPPPRRDRVDVAIAQAIGYVWGWQDAGGSMPKLPDADKSVVWEFGHHYGRIVAEFEAGLKSWHRAIGSEWLAWCRKWVP